MEKGPYMYIYCILSLWLVWNCYPYNTDEFDWTFGESESFRLPDTYYPERQLLYLEYNEDTDSVFGRTEIYIRHNEMSNEDMRQIELNSALREIYSVSVFSVQNTGGNQSLTKIDNEMKLDKFERLKIILDNSTDPTQMQFLLLEIHFATARVDRRKSGKLHGGFYAINSYMKEFNGAEDISGFVSHFQFVFARKAFPCFDEPVFRTKFTLSITVHKDFDVVLFNTDVVNIQAPNLNNFVTFTFNETFPIPSYLVAMLVAKSWEYSLLASDQYFGMPIRVFGDRNDHSSKVLDKDENVQIFMDVIKYTLTYCEAKYGVKYPGGSKLDIAFATHIGGVEQPGLIVIRRDLETLPPLIATLIHELVHQWTGVMMINEWWSSDFWINEGITTWVCLEISRNLVEFWKVHLELNDQLIGFNHYAAVKPIVGDWNQSNLLSNKPMGPQRGMGMYTEMARAVALLNVAMNENLMSCLGVVMNKEPYSTFSSLELLDKLTLCPYSQVNATEFLPFWLVDDEVPVVKLDIDAYINSQGHLMYSANVSYTFICNNGTKSFNDHTAVCYSSKTHFNPQFPLLFRDRRNDILQAVVLVKKNNTQVMLNFNPIEEQIYFVTMYNKGNMIVHYPDSVYRAFFDWIKIDESETPFKLYPFHKYFIMDLYWLAYHGIISPEWIFEICENWDNLENVGIPHKNMRKIDQTLRFYILGNLDVFPKTQYLELAPLNTEKRSWQEYYCSLQQSSPCPQSSDALHKITEIFDRPWEELKKEGFPRHDLFNMLAPQVVELIVEIFKKRAAQYHPYYQ